MPTKLETILATVGGWCCRKAYELEQKRTADLPRCPDCGIEPWDGSEDFDCPQCRVDRVAARDELEMLRSAYDDGYEDAMREGVAR